MCDGKEQASRSALFALGHHLEVPGKPVETVPPGVIDLVACADPVDEAAVREAVPKELVDLATALRVQRWGSVAVANGRDVGRAAVGFVLGMPICLLAPWRNRAWALVPRSAA